MPDKLIMAVRAGRPEHAPESEPVLVSSDGQEVVLTLDDGEQLTFNRRELRHATELEPLAEVADAA